MNTADNDLTSNLEERTQESNTMKDVFELAQDLCKELDNQGIIDRIKMVRQLGALKVPKKYSRSRYDYVCLQLEMHELIRKNIQKCLKISYGNTVRLTDFLPDHELSPAIVSKKNEVTLADIIQLLTIACNIGHFYNTFMASRAVVMLANEDQDFFRLVVESSSNKRYQRIAETVLNEHNYHRTHLLNSYLILEKCDSSNRSVMIAKELILAYLNPKGLNPDSKLHYCFELFRKVRTVAYIAYDLKVAGIPLEIDVRDEEAMLYLLREYLAEYNNNETVISEFVV